MRKRAAFLAAIAMLGLGAYGTFGDHPSRRPAHTFRPVHPVLRVTATAYNAQDGQEWCDRRGCGRVVYLGGTPYVGTIAVSHDLRYLLGRTVRINGWTYRVRDLMADRWRGRIDIYMATVRDAQRWGVQRVTVEVL